MDDTLMDAVRFAGLRPICLLEKKRVSNSKENILNVLLSDFSLCEVTVEIARDGVTRLFLSTRLGHLVALLSCFLRRFSSSLRDDLHVQL